jgi:hypothetical protein
MKKTLYYNKVKAQVRWTLSICLVALLPFLVSCSEDLNELPSQSKVDGNLVVDYASAKGALNGVYYQYAMCGTDNYSVKSTRCSQYYEIFPANLGGTSTYYQGPYMLETHDAASMVQFSSYMWTPLYAAVNAANAVIEQVGASPDSYYTGSQKQEIMGEARGMRALALYNLLRYYGYSWDINSPYGILLRTSKSIATRLPISRSSVKDTYDQIVVDLDYAIEHAPASTDNCYFGKWAAKTLKARVLMMRGQGSDYQDAAALCADIIQNSDYQLDAYEDIFHKNGLKSREVIFGIQPKENQTDVYEAYYYRNSAQYFPTESLLALYDRNGDPRKQSMYKVTPTAMFGYNPDGTSYTYYEDKYTICKHINPTTYNDSTKAFTADELEETQYQMRLSEVYLLRAEALARTGDLAGAKSLLKTVEMQAGITDFTALDAASTYMQLMTEIFSEAIKNFAFECGLEHDYMLRFPEEITLKFNSAYQNRQYDVFPLPTDEFKYNHALTADDQNPGYSAE